MLDRWFTPPFARGSLPKNGLPPAQDVGRASGTLLREFGYFIRNRQRPSESAGRGPATPLRISYPPSLIFWGVAQGDSGALEFEKNVRFRRKN